MIVSEITLPQEFKPVAVQIVFTSKKELKDLRDILGRVTEADELYRFLNMLLEKRI